MKNEERAQLEAHYQNEIESIKGEIARLTDLLEQVLSSKNGKKGFLHNLLWKHHQSTSQGHLKTWGKIQQ